MKNKTLKVKEIFYSLQGEGARIGVASIFIRLAGCNLSCWFCDTDWSDGKEMTVEEIQKEISKFSCSSIVWTGGEPTLQLTNDILKHFPDYYNCIETNGTNPVPSLIDYIACAPKKDVCLQTLHKNFPEGVDEFRYPIDAYSNNLLPEINDLPNAKYYYLSPIFTGKERKEINAGNLIYCLKKINEDPRWRLSVQLHKLINIK